MAVHLPTAADILDICVLDSWSGKQFTALIDTLQVSQLGW
jgi:hypothetical protein